MAIDFKATTEAVILFEERRSIVTIRNYGPGILEVGNRIEFDNETSVFRVLANSATTFFWFDGMPVRAGGAHCFCVWDSSADGDKINLRDEYVSSPNLPGHDVSGALQSTGSRGVHRVIVKDDLGSYLPSPQAMPGLLYPTTLGLRPGTTAPNVTIWNHGPGVLRVLRKQGEELPLKNVPWESPHGVLIPPGGHETLRKYNNMFLFTAEKDSLQCDCVFIFSADRDILPE